MTCAFVTERKISQVWLDAAPRNPVKKKPLKNHKQYKLFLFSSN